MYYYYFLKNKNEIKSIVLVKVKGFGRDVNTF